MNGNVMGETEREKQRERETERERRTKLMAELATITT